MIKYLLENMNLRCKLHLERVALKLSFPSCKRHQTTVSTGTIILEKRVHYAIFESYS